MLGSSPEHLAQNAWARFGLAVGLLAGALAVLASRPATRSALALLQLFPGPTDAALAGLLLFGVFDPTDELVAGQGRDVAPGIKCRGIGAKGGAQIVGQLMHNATGHLRSTHRATVAETPTGDTITACRRR